MSRQSQEDSQYIIKMGSNEISTLPIVNFSEKNLEPGTAVWESTRDSVRQAMEHHGWFVAEYDQLPAELHHSILEAAKDVLSLPIDVKLKNNNHRARHGYASMLVDGEPVHEGLGIDHVTDIEECRKFAHLMWPGQGNDRFCEIVHAYAKIQGQLEQVVVKMLFESYGVDKYAEEHIRSTRYLLRLLSYRKLPNGEPNKKFITHTDKSFVSILHQNHIRGLELKSENEDKWFPFDPSPTSFVVIAGDALMAWSNDRIQACYHKVEMNDEEPRYSLGFFSFQQGRKIETPGELVDERHPLAYLPFHHDGLLNFYETLGTHLKAHRTMTKAYCGIGSVSP